MVSPAGGSYCLGDLLRTNTGFEGYVVAFRQDGSGDWEYSLVTGDGNFGPSEPYSPQASLTLVRRGIGPRYPNEPELLDTTPSGTRLIDIDHLLLLVNEPQWFWSYFGRNPETGRVVTIPEERASLPDGTVLPQPDPCGPLITCSLVERDSQGSGLVLSGGTTAIEFFEEVILVATIQNDDGDRDNIEWFASHGNILSQDWNTCLYHGPGFEAAVVIGLRISGVAQPDCQSNFQSPMAPVGNPGQVSSLHVELESQGSGQIVSSLTTILELGPTYTLVATILNDDGRRDNILWTSEIGTISNEWNIATYRAPGFPQEFDTVDIIIDGKTQFGSRCTFTIPEAFPSDPGLTLLPDFLQNEWWKTWQNRMSDIIQGTGETIPKDIAGLAASLGGLGQNALDGITGLPDLVVDALAPRLKTLSVSILAGMENVLTPIFGAAFNPIQAAIQAFKFPSAFDLWESFWEQVGVFGSAPITTVVNFFLEALEVAMAGIGGPLWALILEVPDLPDAIRNFIEELANPTSQAAALFGQAAGGAAVSGSITGIIAPALRSIEQWANIKNPNVPLDPGRTVEAFVRGFLKPTPMAENLERHGIGEDPAGLMVDLAIPRLDVNSINNQALRWEMQQAAADRSSLAQGLAAEFGAGISPETGLALVEQIGFQSQSARQLLDARKVLPQIQDLIRFAVREAFDPELRSKLDLDEDFPSDILPFTRGQGLSEEFTRMFWASHWELPSIQQGFEMLHRSSFIQQFPDTAAGTLSGGMPIHPVIDDEGLDLLFREADILPFWRERLKAISFSVVTRVDVRRMYDMNIFSLEQVEQTYRSLGYTDKDAENLTEFVKRLAIQPRLTARNTEVRQQYRDGLIDRDQAFEILRPLIHLDVELAAELETLDLDRQGTRLAREVTAWQTAFRKDLIDEAEFREQLTGLTIPDEEIEFRVKIIGIARAAEDPTPEQEELRAAGRGTVIRRFREGLVNEDQFALEMAALGYTDLQVTQFTVQADLEFETNLTLDLLAAYRGGLRTGRLAEEEFRGNVQLLGIRPELIDAYVEFDQLRRKLEGPTGEEAEIRALGSGPVISRFQEGWTQTEEFRLEMETLGYTDPEIDRYQVLADLRFDFDFKQDSLTVLRSAFNRDVIDGDEFLGRLATLGMDSARAQVHLAREQLRLLDRAEPTGAPPTLPGG